MADQVKRHFKDISSLERRGMSGGHPRLHDCASLRFSRRARSQRELLPFSPPKQTPPPPSSQSATVPSSRDGLLRRTSPALPRLPGKNTYRIQQPAMYTLE